MIQKTVTITSKGTFTLPASVRKSLGLTKAGDKLMLTFHEKSHTVQLTGLPDITAVRKKNAAFLASRGFTPRQLRTMAQDYQNGDGTAAQVVKKYGRNR